jgi:Acetyltransferase (GNAT) domain
MLQVLKTISGTSISEMLPVFGSEEFLASKGSDYGWFVSPQFALPFVIDGRFGKLGFNRLIFTTEAIGLQPDSTAEAEARFLDEVVSICQSRRQIKVDCIATQANAVFRSVPSGSDFMDWGSYVVDLTVPESAIFDAFHAKHRNSIRKATSGCIKVTSTSDIDAVYENLKETMVRQALLYYPSKSYLREMQRRLKDKITFYLASRDDKIQGSAVVLHNHLGAFYYYGGSIAEPFSGSLNLLHFEIMKDLKRKNVPVYDFMGTRIVVDDESKLAGIQRFKRRFSSGMRQGYYFRKIINPLGYRVFRCAVKTYFFLKGSRYTGDAIDESRQRQAPAAKPAPALEQTTESQRIS